MLVRKGGKKAKDATVTRAHASLKHYDILYKNGILEKEVPVRLLRDKRLFMYYRLLRPEFVRDRGRMVLHRLKVPLDHKFPTVKVANPMLVAIAYAKFAKGRGQGARGKVENTDVTGGNAGQESGSAGIGQRGGKAGLGDERSPEGKQGTDGGRAHEALELKKEKECSIDLILPGGKYFEGFVEEDKEKLIRVGGSGYPPPCYESIVGDGCDPADLDSSSDGDGGGSDGGNSDDSSNDLELGDRGTSEAVHDSVLRPECDARVAASGIKTSAYDEADASDAGFDMASESSALISAGRTIVVGADGGREGGRKEKMRLKYGGHGMIVTTDSAR